MGIMMVITYILAYFVDNKQHSMKKNEFTVLKLRAQYAVLSEVCESFAPNSKHEAYIKINSMMSDILLKIEKLNKKKGLPI
jgi:hypothetical protein